MNILGCTICIRIKTQILSKEKTWESCLQLRWRVFVLRFVDFLFGKAGRGPQLHLPGQVQSKEQAIIIVALVIYQRIVRRKCIVSCRRILMAFDVMDNDAKSLVECCNSVRTPLPRDLDWRISTSYFDRCGGSMKE